MVPTTLAGLALLLIGLSSNVGGRRIEQDNIKHKKIETNTIELGGTVRQEHNDNTGDGGVNEELRVQVPLRNPNCPYIALTDEEFDDNGRSPDVPGSALFLQSYSYGRTGNRFSIVSDTLRLGFCCKSKIVSLPPKDDRLATQVFIQGTPGPRNFDFSTAPDIKGFDPTSCPTNITWGGNEAYHFRRRLDDQEDPYYTPGLVQCVEALPPLIGCEAAYLFPIDVDVCLPNISGDEGDEEQDLEGGSEERTIIGQESAGNLVMHVRSGDIFFTPYWYKGQPPLQFFLRAIEHQNWERIDVVTGGDIDERHVLNPVVPALEAKLADGELPANTYIHKNRSMEEDLSAMICADALLAVSQSTLAPLVSHHSFASRIYFPAACHESPSRDYPVSCNEKLIRESARAGTQVFGMVSHQENYSVYQRWAITPEQLDEMLTFEIAGFEQCMNGSRSDVREGDV